MNIRALSAIVFGATTSFATAQLQYSFTVGPDPISDVYIFNVNSFEVATAVTYLGGDWTPGEQWSGTVSDFGPEAASFLVFVATFTDPGTGYQGMTMSVPTPVANTLISNNVPWDQDPNNPNNPYFNNSTYFPFGLMPNEATAVQDVLGGHVYGMAESFAYMNSGSTLYAPPGNSTMVDFDGAIFGGTFSYSPSPEPTSLLALGLGCGLFAYRSKRRKIDVG
jgi:hypothetical protein